MSDYNVQDEYYQIPYNYPGSFLLRFFAAFLDGIFLAIISLILWGVASLVGVTIPEFIINLLTVAYFVYCHWKGGATIGKSIFSLRVQTEDGKPITLQQSLLRQIFGILGLVSTIALGGEVSSAAILGLVILIDPLWALTNKDRRAIHDLVANTFCRQKTL
jgi:uncharacterized RDD family membrane protein YckC